MLLVTTLYLLYINDNCHSDIGSTGSEADPAESEWRPPGSPRWPEEGRNRAGGGVFYPGRPSHSDEQKHETAGRRVGEDGERRTAVVRSNPMREV